MKYLKSLKPFLKVQKKKFGMMDNYQKKKQTEQFEKQISDFLSKDTYTLMDYKEHLTQTIQDQKKGIMKKLLNNDESSQSESIEQRTILNAFFPEELLNYRKIEESNKMKSEIAVTAGTTVDRVDFVFKNFKNMYFLHNWLNEIKISNGVMPADQEEMMYRFRMDRKIPYYEKIKMVERNRKVRVIQEKEMKVRRYNDKIMKGKFKKRQVWKIVKYHNY